MSLTNKPSLKAQLLTFTLSRTVLNTGYRMVYPFLPAFARGLNVELSVLALAVSIRAWLGLGSPLLGSLADIRGRKNSMLIGVAIFTSGFIFVTLWPTVWGLFIALIFSSLGKIVFDPAVQAFLGDHIEYAQRGTAIAITELGWSAAYLIGIPLVGYLIANWGWRAPFPIIVCLGLVVGWLLHRAMPTDAVAKYSLPSVRSSLKYFIKQSSALAAVSIGILTSAGNEAVAIVFGAWMEQAFQINVAALGAASAIIGLSELSGEGFVALLVDRLGKSRSVGIGIAFNTAAAIALPYLGQTLPGALIGLFLFYLSFEFTLVSSIPLLSEMVPEARATTMSSLIAGFSVGRGIGALVGPTLFTYGLLANCILAAAFNIIALILLLTFVRE